MKEQKRGASSAKGHSTFSSTSGTGYSTNDGQHRSTAPKKLDCLLAIWKPICCALIWVPPSCRWDPNKPPKFSFCLNLLFAFAASFTVANLYYNHPILNVLAHDFNVPYEKVAQIPTVMQAGYSVGLLFLCPLGDLFRRRIFVTLLVLFTATMWIGLCITKSLAVFTAISFITAVSTVTPQLMLPLVGELAPPNRRAAALSIVVSGLMLGILIARVLSGTITNFVSWRVVYWLSFGLQSVIFILLYLFMPDYPSTNPQGLNYFRMLWSIVVLLIKHPLLVQSCLISFFTAATFTSFWTTLTFLLASNPYNYSSLVIGLFGLIGIGGMLVGPVYARLVTDRFVPHFSVIIGEFVTLIGIVIGTYTGTFTVAGPILQAFLCDCGFQTAQIANRSAIYSIDPKARNRVNTAFMVATFCGQLMGTAAGNHIYARGGWIRSGSASVCFIGAALLLCFARGPWEEGWVGWHGGCTMAQKDPDVGDRNAAGQAVPAAAESHDEEKGAPEKLEQEQMVERRRYRSSEDVEDHEAYEKSFERESRDGTNPIAAVDETIL